MHKYSLKTEPFDGRHTGEAIKDRLLIVLNEFNLSSSNIIIVSKTYRLFSKLFYFIEFFKQISDKGSNMRKAWKLLKIIHMFCIGHGIHNLLMVDCFPRLTGVPDLLDKVQMIINKLRYRQHELEQEFIRIHDQIKNDLFEIINKAGEALDADLELSYDDIEDADQVDNENENYELELYSINDQRSSKFDYLKKTNTTNNSYEFHTLKKRVVTRWNTILIMLRSYQSNISGIEIILRRLKLFDLILTPSENEIVRDLVDFLSAFKTTTTILSASKSYPTISLCLLLRIVSIKYLDWNSTE